VFFLSYDSHLFGLCDLACRGNSSNAANEGAFGERPYGGMASAV
jgi:hypothetical protein